MIRRNSYRVTGLALLMLSVTVGQPWRLFAQSPEPAKGVKFAQISEADLKTWLTYLSSDELQGRQIFTEGYGNAAQYIADRLKEMGPAVKPLGENGTFFQPVKLKDYRVTRSSTVKVDVNGESRTFNQGEGVTFTATSGGNQTLNFNSVYFAGYATQADLDGKPVKDQLVVSVPNRANQAAGRGGFGGGGGGGRGRAGGSYAIGSLGAKAYVSYVQAPAAPTPAENSLATALTSLADATSAVTQAQQAVRGGGAGFGGRGRGAAAPTACTPPDCDFRTVQKVDGLVPPQFSGSDAFYEFLFSGGPVKFADIKAKADKGEPIAGMTIPAKVTVSINNSFEVVRLQMSKNVVAMIEGTDPVLKNTYVMFGAHLDHVGYSPGRGNQPSPTGCRRRSEVAQAAVVAAGKPVQRPSAPARGAGAPAPGAPAAAGQAAGNRPGGAGAGAQGGAQASRGGAPALAPAIDESRDFIFNGADDDGSGSTTELAIAKAFATGPKPKRSLVFVWHTGEEAGLYGSVYNADFPVVPLDKVQADLNMDMVGRDDCNNIEGDYSNTVFLVGADRISTDLHNLIVETNTTLAKPLALDYELNDAADPEGVYTRSDHYSYAAKGIPIAFFTTGLHPDYHRVSDTVEKITFPKMARIGQLVYQTAFAIANSEKTLERDNKGPRTGFGSKAEVIKK